MDYEVRMMQLVKRATNEEEANEYRTLLWHGLADSDQAARRLAWAKWAKRYGKRPTDATASVRPMSARRTRY